jgi:hypothetical protein
MAYHVLLLLTLFPKSAHMSEETKQACVGYPYPNWVAYPRSTGRNGRFSWYHHGYYGLSYSRLVLDLGFTFFNPRP